MDAFNLSSPYPHHYEEIDERLSSLDISGRDKSSIFNENVSKNIQPTKQRLSSHLNKHQLDINQFKEEYDSDSTTSSEDFKAAHRKGSSRKNSVDDDSDKKQKSLYKTELCRNWDETGHCRYGSKCQYAHGSKDLREIERHPKYKTQICRTFEQTGTCPYGSRCTFRHPKNRISPEKLHLKKKSDSHALTETTATTPPPQSPQSNFNQSQKNRLDHRQWYFTHTDSDLGCLSSFQDDSFLPNAESLLPHELLFDLESPEIQQPQSRCPLSNYVNLPNFSHFQQHDDLSLPPVNETTACKSFFRPWIF